MAQFDESKVINALHPEKAEIGKKYWYSDSIVWLKRKVENNEIYSTLKGFKSPYFEVVDNEDLANKYFLLYPYEEPPKKRMTDRQLAEWCAKCKGQWKYKTDSNNSFIYHTREYCEGEDKELNEDIVLRYWDSDVWVEPTVDIYERDCKKEN